MAHRFKPFNTAFTLAEVLITLGIIGVVAALTIPVLMKNYQNQQYVTGLKKAYTQFNQAMTRLSDDKGCTADLRCTGLFANGVDDAAPFGDEIVKYLSVVKNCSTTDAQGCMSNKINAAYDGSSATNYDWDNQGSARYYRFITADGIAFEIYNRATDCATVAASDITGEMMAQTCGSLNIDVNGPSKGPNFFGRDIFQFNITNGKGPMLCPLGLVGWGGGWWQDQGCGAAGAGANKFSGYYCSGRIVEEGWKMNY